MENQVDRAFTSRPLRLPTTKTRQRAGLLRKHANSRRWGETDQFYSVSENNATVMGYVEVK